jgi:hypothetical protein
LSNDQLPIFEGVTSIVSASTCEAENPTDASNEQVTSANLPKLFMVILTRLMLAAQKEPAIAIPDAATVASMI